MEFFTSRVICRFSGPVSSSVLILILLTVLTGCEKDSRLPFSDKPEIELVSVSHDTIVEYEDRLVIRIRYIDGNGDLGFEDPELYALFVRDLRLADFDDFYIDRKSTRLNSSHVKISYAVFCLKKKKT